MPNVREASVFLEEADGSVEGGIAQPAEGGEWGSVQGFESEGSTCTDGVCKHGNGSSSSTVPPQR